MGNNQSSGDSGGSGTSSGRLSDKRSGVGAGSDHPVLDHSSVDRFNMTRGGLMPPNNSTGPAVTVQPQQPLNNSQHQNYQLSLEDFLNNLCRTSPNAFISLFQTLHARSQQQVVTQQQILGSSSHARSPIAHQQSPQSGIPRPSSGSVTGIPAQHSSGRPGSATSVPYCKSHGSGGGVKYANISGCQSQQVLSDQLAAASAASGNPLHPSSLTATPLRPSSTTLGASVSGYSGLSASSTHLQQAYAAAVTASQLGHVDNLQEPSLGGQPQMHPRGFPLAKRARLFSDSSTASLPTPAAPNSYSLQAHIPPSRQQQQQQEFINRQLLQNAVSNPAAILTLFTNVAQQQQQQQHRAASASGGSRPVAHASYYQQPEAYTHRNSGQHQPGSQFLVSSSPNTLSQATAAASVVAAYNNLSTAQQQQQLSCKTGYTQNTSAASSRGVYQKQHLQRATPPVTSNATYNPQNSSRQMISTGGSGVLRQQTKEPAYYPKVEAISPPPDDDHLFNAVDVNVRREREEMQRRLHEIEARINKEEGQLRYLMDRESSLAADLKTETVPHRKKPSSGDDLRDKRTYENPIQVLISETRARARKQHESLADLCGSSVSASPYALPLYRQPSDSPALQEVQFTYKNGFRCQLIACIRRRMCAEKARLQILAENYDRDLQIFIKRHEMANNTKRKQKNAKHREIFEKTFPEVKITREDEGQVQNKLEDGHESDVNGDQLSDLVEDISKMKEYAIDPPVPLAPWEKTHYFLYTAHKISDPKSEHLKSQSLDKWAEDDKVRFKERFLATPKNFPAIAASLDKTVAECIHYYYLSKKSEGYKALVKKHSTSRRRRAGHSDKSGPTGPSHGTASRKAPPRITTTPGGDNHRNIPHLDYKNEEVHVINVTGSRKAGGGVTGSSSVRVRSGRRGGGDHRPTKGGGRGRSATPVPPQALPASLDLSTQESSIVCTQESDKSTLTQTDKQRPSVPIDTLKTDDNENDATMHLNSEAEPNSTASVNGMPRDDKEIDEKPTSLLVETDRASVAPQITLTASLDPQGDNISSSLRTPPPTALTDLVRGSPAPNASPEPQPCVSLERSVISRSTFSDGGISISLNSMDIMDTTHVGASKPPRAVGLARGDESPSSKLLGNPNIHHLTAFGGTSKGSHSPPQSLARLAMSNPTNPKVLVEGPNQPKTRTVESTTLTSQVQSTDPTVAAYNKAILIGDFCTAQQLARGKITSQQPQPPSISANMSGTGLQRTADYNDPAYLGSRSLDPSFLPIPSNRGVAVRSSGDPRSSCSRGRFRPPSATGSSGSYRPLSLPLKRRQATPQPSMTDPSSMDTFMSLQQKSPLRVLGAGSGSADHDPHPGYGDSATQRPQNYCILSPSPPEVDNKRKDLPPTSLGFSKTGNGSFDPKLEEHIAHTIKLYQEEVELYTSRERSDSMRTRTSSETSQQMHSALDTARKRVFSVMMGFAGVCGSSSEMGSAGEGGCTIPPILAGTGGTGSGSFGGLSDIEVLSKYGPQYASLIAAAAAVASGAASPPSPTTSSSVKSASRTTFCSSHTSGSPSVVSEAPRVDSQYTSISPVRGEPPPLHLGPPYGPPIPRYRKSVGGAGAPGLNPPPLHSKFSPQRGDLPRPWDDAKSNPSVYLRHHHHHQQQQRSHHLHHPPHQCTTLMRASGSVNLDSVGLSPEELARKMSVDNTRSQQTVAPQLPPATCFASRMCTSQTSALLSSTQNNPLVVCSALSNHVSEVTWSTLNNFRSPELKMRVTPTLPTTEITSISPSTRSSCSSDCGGCITGTLGDQIEKAITDGILMRNDVQVTAMIKSSTVIENTNAEDQRVASSSSSTRLLTSPQPSQTLPFHPKKRSRLGLASGCVASPKDLPSPSGSSIPRYSPLSKDSGPCSKLPAVNTMHCPISGTSPLSSAESPGNLQICLPAEEDTLQCSPTGVSGQSYRPSPTSRIVSSASPTQKAITSDSSDPRRNESPFQKQQQQPPPSR